MKVVGKAQKQPEKVLAFLNYPNGIEAILHVSRLEPYYKSCFVSVVPLLNGSGTGLKILESAAYGRLVLSTEIGMVSLDFCAEKNIFLFKNANSFMKGYKALLDEERYAQVAHDALHVIKERYSTQAFLSKMDKN